MKWKTPEKREYYSKYERVDIKSHQGWFECYKLPNDVYAICEPQHFQEVNAFLIVGSKGAILFDTGMGIANIKAVVDELYQGELTVVNSHFHFDHIGDNFRFDEIVVPNDEYVRNIAGTGLPATSLGNQFEEDMFLFGYPEGFDHEHFLIKPYNTRIAQEGEIFDLGNRKLEYITTPGHSGDCIMLYDLDFDTIFCGDMFYLGALYLHFDCKEFGKSNLDMYIQSMDKVIPKYPSLKSIYASHNDFIIPAPKFTELLAALISVKEKRADTHSLTNLNHGYLEEPGKLMEYNFDGFSIVIKD